MCVCDAMIKPHLKKIHLCRIAMFILIYEPIIAQHAAATTKSITLTKDKNHTPD